MNLQPNEEQQMLVDSVRSWTAAEYSFDARQQSVGNGYGFSPDTWQAMADMGWLSLPYTERDGGFGGGPVETMLLMERFGEALVAEPYIANIILAGGVARCARASPLRDSLITGICSAETQTALAFVEPQARYDLNNVTTLLRPAGNGYVIDGSKSVVLNGAAAESLVVVARVPGEDGIVLVLVPSDADGVRVAGYATQDGARAADIQFDGVRIDQDAVLARSDMAAEILDRVIDEAAFAVSAEAVGIMTFLLNATVEYTKSRRQFGVPIGSFQALQHRMADMFDAVEQARSIVIAAAGALQSGGGIAPAAVSACKYFTGKAGRHVGQESIQMHGGIGVTNELNVAHYFKRLTMIDSMFGNSDYHLRRYANLRIR